MANHRERNNATSNSQNRHCGEIDVERNLIEPNYISGPFADACITLAFQASFTAAIPLGAMLFCGEIIRCNEPRE